MDACNTHNLGDAQKSVLFSDVDAIIAHLLKYAEVGDAVVLMSNGSFNGIHQKLAGALAGVEQPA